jgi:non-specific serine/threonine protein kinase/serine/threonine-protein kinase
MMNERFQEISELFEQARTLEATRRDDFLAEACGEDRKLLEEVRELLAQHEDDDCHVLDRPMITPLSVPEWESSDDVPPQRIGQYQIIRRIGRGGMGLVYLAKQDSPSRTVAVKVIRPGLISRKLLRRFDLEASMLGRLQHPGIAQIYEAGVHQDGETQRPFFAMEFIEGVDLAQHLSESNPSQRSRLLLFAKIVDAVHYAHQKGVIHRDLKPGNILIRTDGSSGGATASESTTSSPSVGASPKILDFGVARATESDLLASTMLTEAGQLVGTLPYMSPEQVGGRLDRVDTRSDVYSLGVILYEMLTDRLPYDLAGKSLVAAAKTIAESEPSGISSGVRERRDDLTTIVFKALEKQPERRYASAADLAGDIRRYLSDEPILARPASTVYQIRKFAKRNRGLVAGCCAAVLMLVGGIATTSWQAVVANRQRERALEEAAFAKETSDFYRRVLSSGAPGLLGNHATLREVLEYAIGLLEKEPPSDPRLEAAIRDALSAGLVEMELIDEAQPVISSDDETSESTIENVASRSTRAVVLMKQGKFAEAEHLLRQNLEFSRQNGNDVNTAILLTRLADLCKFTSRFAEAKQLAGEAVELYDKARDEGDPEWDVERSCYAMVVLSGAKLKEGEAAEAETTLLKVIELASEHEAKAMVELAKNALASLYSETGRAEKAVPILRAVVASQSLRLRSNNPQLAILRVNLGSMLSELGRLEEAETELLSAVAVFEEQLPTDHPTILTANSMLGNLRFDQGRCDEAAQIFEDVLARKTKVLGREHFDTTISIVHMGRVHAQLEEWGLATEFMQEALKIRRETLGESNPRTLSALLELAKIHESAQNLTSCLPLYEELLQSYEASFGSDHEKTAEIRSKIATLRSQPAP